jgi:hypothetical protein
MSAESVSAPLSLICDEFAKTPILYPCLTHQV